MPGSSTPPNPRKYALPSIQTVYNLYTGREYKEGIPTLHCKNVIKLPIAEPVARKSGDETYIVTPYTALVIENTVAEVMDDIKIVIETNEGVTVEPIIVHAPFVQYDTAYLLNLPRGTTGIKKAYIREIDAHGFIIQNDLVFDIMETPYNYENYLFSLLNLRLNLNVRQIFDEIENLEGRVTALENKAGT